VGTRVTAIHLEIRLDGESPTGRAYDERGCTREFAGWMALVATIDDFLGTAHTAAHTTGQPASAPPSSEERSGS
jgi:hypothetical protein